MKARTGGSCGCVRQDGRDHRAGEHGVGMEKMDAMHLVFGEVEIEAQRKVKRALDPRILPTPGRWSLPGGRWPMPRDLDGLHGQLSQIVGGENLIGGPAPTLRRGWGDGPDGGAPGDAGGRGGRGGHLGTAGVALVPWGGGTAMALGNPPARDDVVVCLDRLTRVVEFDAANLVPVGGSRRPAGRSPAGAGGAVRVSPAGCRAIGPADVGRRDRHERQRAEPCSPVRHGIWCWGCAWCSPAVTGFAAAGRSSRTSRAMT